MSHRKADMQIIFSQPSEKNKEIIILTAKKIKGGQESTEQSRNPSKQAT